ncbi:MAG: hypothetical protein KDK91_31415, partial [Gammaproteobacteria bacterium]|nr:hypothetical protein [Gammaproteobacteria bacterium]
MNDSRPSVPEMPSGRLLHRVDLIITVCLIALCGWLYYLTTTFDEVPPLLGENVGPEFFPRLMLWFVGLLSLGMPFE